MKSLVRLFWFIIITLALLFLFNFFKTHIVFIQEKPHSKQIFPASQAPETTLKIALFNTAAHNAYIYKPISDIAHANNFAVDYYPIQRILDTPIKTINLDQYDGIFFAITPEFLKKMAVSPASKKILMLMKKFSQYPHKLTGLLFPSMRLAHPAPMLAMAPLFECVGITPKPSTFFKLTNQILQLPLEYRGMNYNTTLNLPKIAINTFPEKQIFNKKIAPLALLPIKQKVFSPEIKNMFPFGIYWFNPKHQNHIIVGHTSLLSLTGISENFQLCPSDFKTRETVHEALNETMWEINQLLTQKKKNTGINIKRITKHQSKNIQNAHLENGIQMHQECIRNPYKIAWMETVLFNPKNTTKNKEQMQRLLVNFILDSGIDSLWLTINPQMYYSPIGKNKKETQSYLTELSLFTKQLSEKAKKLHKTPPSILIGYEITNNIYKPNLPQEHAHDLYGNTYPDIPRPLDKIFWNNEIKKPLVEFLKDWKKPSISNGIKLSGVMLDLEMYCRQSTGTFLSTMGFEPQTIKEFLNDTSSVRPERSRMDTNASSNMDQLAFTNYMISKKISSQYFDYLEKESTKLGKNLRKFFMQQLPNSIIGCYAPNISVDWFYKGFYKGLSTKKHPIKLFTFNSEFNSYKPWLEQNDIHAQHYGVLMLSKLKDKHDFTRLNYVLKHHTGAWLNRFSRLVEPFDKAHWSSLEQTPLSMKNRQAFIEYLGTTKQ